MSVDGAVERKDGLSARKGAGNGMVAAAAMPSGTASGRTTYGERRLRLNPNTEHRPERYDDVQAEFDPAIFSSLERHLPLAMLEAPRVSKVQFMKEILSRYLPDGERNRVRSCVLSSYIPLFQLGFRLLELWADF